MALATRNWLAGAELGHRFTDVRLLHAGSRFTIYEAREAKPDRTVVIKVPDESSASWLHEVLDQEAAILAEVAGHPNIVTFYQRMALEDGRPALVLERCTGSLADELRGGARLSLQAAVATGIKLAGAVETLHHAGVLHCDIRPDNVLRTEFDEPVLAGFDEAVRRADVATRAPLHVTTPHTAPELLEGKEPSPVTDVYGLASTMYELVAGRAAFRAYAGESPAAVIVRVLSGQVKPIAGPDVPLEMSDLLTWGMRPDPGDRPPSPAWLAEELGRIERGQGWPRTRMVSA
jgi:serine/threonine-protein kinase PknK